MNFKVAASDFDGTLYRDQKISAEDLAAIKNWQAAGNKFGVVTGRCRPIILPFLEKFGLKVDFLICDNGAIIFDGDGQIIFESEISKKFLTAVVNEPCAAKSFHLAYEAADEIFGVNVKSNSWLLGDVQLLNFPLTFIDAAQIAALPKKINQFALGFDEVDDAQFAADELNQKFGELIFAQMNTRVVDVVPAGINKAQGVKNLLQKMNWDAEVFVIGDEANDLPMIRTLGGYTVSTARDFVKREAKAIFDSVGAMLNHFA